ncbi:MAG: hypothetical protein PHP46_05450 [Candidatus Omnitrophica bacterium]|nr:hypothetical protein [Candidatus Omnitrophota bacterium]
MTRRTELPEERLLNLIKRNDRKPAVKSLITKSPGPKADFLKNINRYLAIGLGLLVFYLIYFVVHPAQYRIHTAAPSIRTAAAVNRETVPESAPKADDYAQYSAIIGQKQLFESIAGAAAAQESIQSGNAANNFNLVGIIPGDSPQAIIEDRNAGKTYYISKGASINGAVVREINNGKVVMDSNGESISLVL